MEGPSDGEAHSLGKEGAERYRVHNLPKYSGPGVYELGIYKCQTGLARDMGKLDPECVVPVYVGQAEDVRTRLQQYGRNGAHLGNSCSTTTPSKCPGLFEEMFSGGYPIVFRWASMRSTSDAQETEKNLLEKYDYPWNRRTNERRRYDEIHKKLNKPSSQKQLVSRINVCKYPLTDENFDTCSDEESQGHFSGVLKFGRSQPRLVLDRSVVIHGNDAICGAVLGHDSVCLRPPVEGRKRCAEHKGMKIKGSVDLEKSTSDLDSQSISSAPSSSRVSDFCGGCTPICGFILADGSPCRSQPLKGNKRCLEHKGRRIHEPTSVSVRKEKPDHLVSKSNHPRLAYTEKLQVQAFPNGSYTNCDKICGVVLRNGRLCTRKPVAGRVRCAEHKGMRV